MYAVLQRSYQELEDKSGIDTHLLRHPGFDGNNESTLMGLTRAIREARMFDFVEINPTFNSHCPSIGIFQRMLGQFRKLGEPNALSKEQLVSVLAARRFDHEPA